MTEQIQAVGIGSIFIDDIVRPDGTTHMAQLGGGVVHALMGMAIWDEHPGLVALAGNDLPETIRNKLRQHFDTRGLHFLEIPQIRAWQIFEADGTRRELYRVAITEPFIKGAQPHHLPDFYRTSRAYYFLQDFKGIQTWCRAVDGIILWEPLQQIMQPGNRAALRECLQTRDIDIVSPNLEEARAVYGEKSPDTLITLLLEDGA
jgi:sugar/nucleoside kinase (ribokinase family)